MTLSRKLLNLFYWGLIAIFIAQGIAWYATNTYTLIAVIVNTLIIILTVLVFAKSVINLEYRKQLLYLAIVVMLHFVAYVVMFLGNSSIFSFAFIKLIFTISLIISIFACVKHKQ